MKIIDNFLDYQTHKHIHDTMLGDNFPWFITPITQDKVGISEGTELSHSFHNNHTINSNYWNVVVPIVEKINPKALLRIRAALMPSGNQDSDSGWHTDYEFACTTAIYYVNSNNGYTLFEDGTVVESVANRFVYFDSLKRHTGIRSTDADFRCLINFNYF
jgi:hypothetical protein